MSARNRAFLTPWASRDLDLRLPSVSWDVPAGHRLALVVDGHDGLYLDDNDAFDTVAFTGPS